MTQEDTPIDVATAREKIGQIWGLERAITKAELARALKLSDKHGGDYVGRLEKGTAPLGGPALVAIKAFLAGYRPDNMDDVIKAGYPRGPVR